MTYAIHKADVTKWLNDYGDKIEAGQALPFHACLCAPPYYLGSIVKRFGDDNAAPAQYGTDGLYQRASQGFMGATWDGFDSPLHFQTWCTEWGKALLRCLYPNAVVFIFGGTRTFHRLVSGLEDAGFEIYDSLGVQTYQYVYGTGFPKGVNISKFIDKSKGLDRDVIGTQKLTGTARIKVGIGAAVSSASDGYETSEIRDSIPITANMSDEAQQWDGYNTLLKPAIENILFARAPRGNKTYVETALEFGTGALNIDGTRIETDESWSRNDSNDIRGGKYIGSKKRIDIEKGSNPKGRYPSNLLLTHHPDCTDESCHEHCHVKLLGGQSVVTNAGGIVHGKSDVKSRVYGKMKRGGLPRRNDKGRVSRYFYSAKSQTWERDAGLKGKLKPKNEGHYSQDEWSKDNMGNTPDNYRKPIYNNHPTVKPIEMLTYLATMLKPPVDDSRILVPFAGSASEMIAAHLAGWGEIVGIELDENYIEIAQHRLAYWTQFNTYEAVKAANALQRRVDTKQAAKRKSGQLSMFDGD